VADPSGGVEFTQLPPSIVRGTNTSFPVAVRAGSGGGTAMESVDVRLYVDLNRGAKVRVQGSFEDCSGANSSTPVNCTGEADGVAAFQIKINQPGVYILCAEGSANGFVFEIACTPRFHVRPH
jgi:hypothetical protein